MRITNVKGRKAISPVIATVILIAITLIAAIAIAGFVFGLFGSFTASAQITAAGVSCVASSSTCSMSMVNSGNANAYVISCSFSGANGGTGTPSVSGSTAVVTAGSTLAFTCTAPAALVPVSGAQASGTVSMSNGASIPFSGTWE